MKITNRYLLEYLFLATVILLSITGFWNIYFGSEANPTPYHHLHVITSFTWLLLLLYQLQLVGRNRYRNHRRVGLFILVVGPLLVASTALLSVHSAHKGLVSGQGDFFIVPNVMVTLELGMIILLAFILRQRKKVHGAFLLSTAILFMDVALVFTLTGFVSPFKIEGPETVFRFEIAATVGEYVCLAVGCLFFFKDVRNGWPVLLVGSFPMLNDAMSSFLAARDLIGPLTEFIGSRGRFLAFSGTFVVCLALLASTGILTGRRSSVVGAQR